MRVSAVQGVLSFFAVGACLGQPDETALPTDEAVLATFEELHSQVYQAYEVGLDRDALHDLLSKSFSGRALTEEYVEHFVTAVKMTEEETSIQVLNIDYSSVVVQGWVSNRVDVVADWSVGGVVTHRGHKHPRVNRYRAKFVLDWSSEPRIVGSQIQRLERIRGAFDGGEDWTGSAADGSGFLDAADLLLSGVEVSSEEVNWSLDDKD